MKNLILLLFFISCSNGYVKFDKNKPAETGSIQAKSNTLVFTYIVNKSTTHKSKGKEYDTFYKCSAEDKNPFLNALKNSFKKNSGLVVLDESALKKSATINSIEGTEEEELLNLSGSPLINDSKLIKLIPKISKETESEQILLAKVNYYLSEKVIKEDLSEFKLHTTLTVLIYDKTGKLIFSSEKSNERKTDVVDDNLNLATFLGDVLTAAFQSKVNIPINGSCRPVLYENLNDLWNSTIVDLKIKYPGI